MIGTNDNTLRVKNGEVNTKTLIGVDFNEAVAEAYRKVGYGQQYNVSNKPSEHNIMSMAVTRATFFPAAPVLNNRQTNKLISRNVVFPRGRA